MTGKEELSTVTIVTETVSGYSSAPEKSYAEETEWTTYVTTSGERETSRTPCADPIEKCTLEAAVREDTGFTGRRAKG